jgi:phytoene dehydrogenase-like protein
VSNAPDALIVGAGPNGLAAAVTLASAGLGVHVLEAAGAIGGGARTAELTIPGLRHDVCSAIHCFGVASPYFASLPLEDHGLEWRWPEIELAHPLDGGRAAALYRSLDATGRDLGVDGSRWRRLFGPLVDHFDDLAADVLRPLTGVPRHPLLLARFGLRGLPPATLVARAFATDEARALFGGCAAHSMERLDRPATAAVGALLAAVGHRHGWPVAAGGSGAVTAALASLLGELGGTIETGCRVDRRSQLPPARLTLFDTSPEHLLSLYGDRLPSRARRAYARWRRGPAAFKVDLAVEGGVPWTSEACRRAGTVHVGGRLEEIAASEAVVATGRVPERPFVLVAQQYLCDEQRSVGDVHPVWAYAHVPNGYGGDATAAVLAQMERFAPGLRDRIVAMATMGPADYEAYNANDRGGDISLGATDLRQLVLRPRASLDPYSTGIPGVFICSAATPPGPGVHGMCGHLAAVSALHQIGHPRTARPPLALPPGDGAQR